MGRTIPTYRLHLESILDRWMDYRRALREKDRELFDRMTEKARAHSSAASFCAHLDPIELAFLSIMLEMQREMEEMRERQNPSATPTEASASFTGHPSIISER